MKQFAKYVLATIVGLIVTFFLIGLFFFSVGISMAASGKKKADVAANSILELDIKNLIVDNSNSDDPVEIFLTGNPNLRATSVNQIKKALRRAKEDDKIKGMFIKIGLFDGGFASLQDIKQAIEDFKTSGKFVYAHADFMDEKGFFLASSADSIFMNPSGDFFLNGFASSMVYFEEALSKVGVEMQAIRVGEFKGAVEPYTSNKISEENKKQVQAYLDEIYRIFLEGSSAGTSLSVYELKNIADSFKIQSVKDAIVQGVVADGLFIDQVKSQFATRVNTENEDLKFISYNSYLNRTSSNNSATSGKRIAIIYANGEIGMGKGGYDNIGSEGMSEILRKVRKDDNIKAVVLRINSPGGSALASDIIWREVKLTQAKKPVIVSMGNVAASGGYFIAAPADTIIAQPATLTGSIGVFLIMPNAQELMEDKIGVHPQTVKTSPYADFGSIERPLRANERAILQGYANRVYDDFLDKVSAGRQMDKDAVDSIAKGRVWVGTQAKEIGLVDILGNLDTAINIAKWKAGINGAVAIENFPKRKNPLEAILDYKGSIKASWLQEEMGVFHGYYKSFSKLMNQKGPSIEMRLPFELNIR